MTQFKYKRIFKVKMINLPQKNLPAFLKLRKNALVRSLRKHGVLQAGIFGSYARGEQKKRSDIDILVKTKKGTSLIDFVGIKHSVEKVLGKSVDLVEYSAIKPRIKEQILNDEVRIL